MEDVAGGGAGEEVGRLGFGDGGGAGGSRRKLAEDAPEGRGEGRRGGGCWDVGA